MLDIRDLLEKQLERLHQQSNLVGVENTAEITFAMLAIVDVLYPNGIPETKEETMISHQHKCGKLTHTHEIHIIDERGIKSKAVLDSDSVTFAFE